VAEHTALLAFDVFPTDALKAGAAGGAEAAQDAVADGDAIDVGAGVRHGPDELVSDRESRFDPDATVVDVQVRPADPRRLDAHDRVVAGEQLWLGSHIDADLAGRLEGDGSHARSLRGRHD
jgi:hypothetical protein